MNILPSRKLDLWPLTLTQLWQKMLSGDLGVTGHLSCMFWQFWDYNVNKQTEKKANMPKNNTLASDPKHIRKSTTVWLEKKTNQGVPWHLSKSRAELDWKARTFRELCINKTSVKRSNAVQKCGQTSPTAMQRLIQSYRKRLRQVIAANGNSVVQDCLWKLFFHTTLQCGFLWGSVVFSVFC